MTARAWGHRVGVYDKGGNLLTRFGRPEEGEGPDQFIAPHGIDVDSRGDLYVCDVGYTVRGRLYGPAPGGEDPTQVRASTAVRCATASRSARPLCHQ